MEKLKRVALAVACREEDAEAIAKIMEDSFLSSLGLYCLEYGSISDCTPEEQAMVESQLPDDADDTPYTLEEDTGLEGPVDF